MVEVEEQVIYFLKKGLFHTKILLKLNQRTLYITETIGHGSNLVTGDYSVGATWVYG